MIGSINSYDCDDNHFEFNALFSPILADVSDELGGVPISLLYTGDGTLVINTIDAEQISFTWSGQCIATTLMGSQSLTFDLEIAANSAVLIIQ